MKGKTIRVKEMPSFCLHPCTADIRIRPAIGPSGAIGAPSMRAVFSSHPGRQNWSWVCTIQNIFNVHAWHIVLTSLCPSCDISGSRISLYKAFLSLKHKQLITVCVSFLTCLSQDFENWSACLWYSSLLDTCVFSSLLIWHLMNFCELSALEELQQFRNLTRLALTWRQKTNKGIHEVPLKNP